MRKKQLIFFVLFITLLPLVSWAQSRNHNMLHLSIRKNNGDSVQIDANLRARISKIQPLIKDDKVVWSFGGNKGG